MSLFQQKLMCFLETTVRSLKRHFCRQCHRAIVKTKELYTRLKNSPKGLSQPPNPSCTLAQLRNGPIIYVDEQVPQRTTFLRRTSKTMQPRPQVIYTTQLSPQVAVIRRRSQCQNRDVSHNYDPHILTFRSWSG